MPSVLNLRIDYIFNVANPKLGNNIKNFSYDGNGNWGFGVRSLPVGIIGPGNTLLRVSVIRLFTK